MSPRPLLAALAFALLACERSEQLPAANAEYETLVALGAYRGHTAAELCPPAGSTVVALRHGVAQLVRRPSPLEVELSVEGHPARAEGDRTLIDRTSQCQGLVRVRFSRQKEQWFIEDLRVVSGP